MKKYRDIIAVVVVVLVVLVVGFFAARKYLWWFTDGYGPRQTVQAFFTDASKGKISDSYALTTPAFQSKNSLSKMQSTLDVFSGDKVKITYLRYTKASGAAGTIVVGSVNNTTSSITSNYLINVVNNKIDSINVVSYPSQ